MLCLMQIHKFITYICMHAMMCNTVLMTYDCIGNNRKPAKPASIPRVLAPWNSRGKELLGRSRLELWTKNCKMQWIWCILVPNRTRNCHVGLGRFKPFPQTSMDVGNHYDLENIAALVPGCTRDTLPRILPCDCSVDHVHWSNQICCFIHFPWSSSTGVVVHLRV